MQWIDNNDENRRRNVLSIRFNDHEHRIICDKAWRERLSVSGMLRDLILREYEKLGILKREFNQYSIKKGKEAISCIDSYDIYPLWAYTILETKTWPHT